MTSNGHAGNGKLTNRHDKPNGHGLDGLDWSRDPFPPDGDEETAWPRQHAKKQWAFDGQPIPTLRAQFAMNWHGSRDCTYSPAC